MTRIWYCTQEQVKEALDFKETARNNRKIADSIASASESIEKEMHRRFYPEDATRFFNYPNWDYAQTWVLYLGEFEELISLTTLKSGTTVIPSTDYNLEPVNAGPPFTRIELRLDKSSSFGQSATHQRDVSALGVFGYKDDEDTSGTVTEALDASETDVDVSDSSEIGVGSLIRVDNERMNVTKKTFIDSTQTVQTDALTAKSDNVTVKVTTGSDFFVDEVILIDSEKMLIVDIAGNSLTVKRAWDGSVLAAHTVATIIYVPRRLTVERGVLGSTAATHLINAPVKRFIFPYLVNELCIAITLTGILQKQSGFARVVGLRNYNLRNVQQREAIGRGLDDLYYDCYKAHGRKFRKDAI